MPVDFNPWMKYHLERNLLALFHRERDLRRCWIRISFRRRNSFRVISNLMLEFKENKSIWKLICWVQMARNSGSRKTWEAWATGETTLKLLSNLSENKRGFNRQICRIKEVQEHQELRLNRNRANCSSSNKNIIENKWHLNLPELNRMRVDFWVRGSVICSRRGIIPLWPLRPSIFKASRRRHRNCGKTKANKIPIIRI